MTSPIAPQIKARGRTVFDEHVRAVLKETYTVNKIPVPQRLNFPKVHIDVDLKNARANFALNGYIDEIRPFGNHYAVACVTNIIRDLVN